MRLMSESDAQKLNDAIQKYAKKYNNLEFKLMVATIESIYGYGKVSSSMITLAIDSAEFVCGVTIRKNQYKKLMRWMRGVTSESADGFSNDNEYIQIRNFLRLFGWSTQTWESYLKS